MLIAVFALYTASFASTGFTNVPKKANQIYLPIGKNMQISLMDLSVISIKDYEKVSGKHLNFFQKISFKAAQKQLRHSISSDGTITSNKLLKALSSDGITSGFNIGCFALGFFLGRIGVLLSYVINGD